MEALIGSIPMVRRASGTTLEDNPGCRAAWDGTACIYLELRYPSGEEAAPVSVPLRGWRRAKLPLLAEELCSSMVRCAFGLALLTSDARAVLNVAQPCRAPRASA